MWPNSRQQPLFAALVAILLIGAIAWEVAAVASRMKQFQSIGEPTPAVRQISTTGSGKVRAAPDIAIVTAGFTVQGTEVRATQQEANHRMTELVAAVKGAGVAAEDIQTNNFSINPRYAYLGGRSRIDGYEASQSIEIRIRNLDRVNDILAAAGGAGATNIGGLRFTIDDPQMLQSEARGKAITAARAEALTIARQLGVRLGRIIAFNESTGGMPRPLYAEVRGLGIGGGGDIPTVEQGSTEVTSNVTVTYELE